MQDFIPNAAWGAHNQQQQPEMPIPVNPYEVRNSTGANQLLVNRENYPTLPETESSSANLTPKPQRGERRKRKSKETRTEEEGETGITRTILEARMAAEEKSILRDLIGAEEPTSFETTETEGVVETTEGELKVTKLKCEGKNQQHTLSLAELHKERLTVGGEDDCFLSANEEEVEEQMKNLTIKEATGHNTKHEDGSFADDEDEEDEDENNEDEDDEDEYDEDEDDEEIDVKGDEEIDNKDDDTEDENQHKEKDDEEADNKDEQNMDEKDKDEKGSKDEQKEKEQGKDEDNKEVEAMEEEEEQETENNSDNEDDSSDDSPSSFDMVIESSEDDKTIETNCIILGT